MHEALRKRVEGLIRAADPVVLRVQIVNNDWEPPIGFVGCVVGCDGGQWYRDKSKS